MIDIVAEDARATRIPMNGALVRDARLFKSYSLLHLSRCSDSYDIVSMLLMHTPVESAYHFCHLCGWYIDKRPSRIGYFHLSRVVVRGMVMTDISTVDSPKGFMLNPSTSHGNNDSQGPLRETVIRQNPPQGSPSLERFGHHGYTAPITPPQNLFS